MPSLDSLRSRRELLVAGSAAIAGLAGCTLGSTAPPASASDLADYDCPPHETSRERAVCSQTVADADAVSLRPSEPVADDPTALGLTLHNDSDAELRFNPKSWTIRRERTLGWAEIERRWSGDASATVAPGETHAWTFAEAVRSVNPDVDLGPGTYSAAIGVPDPRGDDWLACIALVALR